MAWTLPDGCDGEPPTTYARPTVARLEATQAPGERVASARLERMARWIPLVVAGSVVSVMAPVVIRGGLLADEYIICLRPVHDGGYGPYLSAIWADTGVVRPARFLELFLVSSTCRSVPYGVVIAIPLVLKLVVAYLLFGLLRDLSLRAPWPAIGAALWLLEPLGTEAALWPAALHVLLGIALALVGLRCFHRGLVLPGAAFAAAASLSIEQAIFAMPFAAWLITPPEHRRRAVVAAVCVAVAILAAYTAWPGSNPRQALTLAERLDAAMSKGAWYVYFPAVGLGLHSGALAIAWAFPLSIVILIGGAVVGTVVLPRVMTRPSSRLDRHAVWRGLIAFGVLVLLVNLPLIVTEVGYSARTFTPTWVVLSGAAAVGASRVSWERTRLLGAAAGVFAAVALLSLALSVSVRVRTDAFDRAAARWIAARTRDGDVVAVCDVGRTVVDPAPLGAFHLHALHSTSGDWIEYHTGRVVEVRRSGERYWGARCPDLAGADLVVRFPDLVAQVGRSTDG
jgi:hypothetical protein